MAELRIGTVDVYVIRPRPEGWLVLALQRAAQGTRCPLAWETVHGRLEPGEEPEHAAVREVREETGLEVARLYNVTVQPFYLHASHTVQMAVVFAAFVDEPANAKPGGDRAGQGHGVRKPDEAHRGENPVGTVVLGPEHQRFEWLPVDAALARFVWPREREAMQHIVALLSGGDAGPVEDVLRVF